jgi:hypothetical protein
VQYLAGIKASAAKKANFVDDLITPKMNTKATETAIKSGKVVEGTGIAGKRNYTDAIPNFDKVKASVNRVPGISNKNTLLQNSNAIHDEIGVVAKDLESKIKGKGFFSPSEFKGYMKSVQSELADNPLMVGDAETTATKIVSKFNTLVAKEGYTPEGLLKARKALDAWMKIQKGSSVFDPAKENAVSIALRAIRQGGNDFLASRVKDVAVRDMLSHQSNLYQAIENIAPKAAKEGESSIARLFNSKGVKVAEKLAAGAAIAGTAIGLGKLTFDN